MTLRILRELYHIDTSEARSKSWDEFKRQDIDFLITLCDDARESCPVWPGQPVTAHWNSPDPAAAQGAEEEIFDEFRKVALLVHRRVELFCSLPIEKLDRFRLTELVGEIGREQAVAAAEPALTASPRGS